MKIEGKTVLITGAARRIGHEIALTLARAGADIVIHYRDSKQEALGLQKKIQAMRRSAYLVSADFSHSKKPLMPAIQAFAAEVYRKASRIDVLVNNASIFYPTEFEKISEKDWDAFLTTNLKAPFFLSKEIGKRMLRQKSGKIINLVDWIGERPAARFIPYAISKAGLIAATKGLAKVLAPKVQVMGIAPGPMLPAEHASAKERKAAAEKSLLKHYGSAQDIANTVKFLIEGTDFMTGSIVSVEGGASLV